MPACAHLIEDDKADLDNGDVAFVRSSEGPFRSLESNLTKCTGNTLSVPFPSVRQRIHGTNSDWNLPTRNPPVQEKNFSSHDAGHLEVSFRCVAADDQEEKSALEQQIALYVDLKMQHAELESIYDLLFSKHKSIQEENNELRDTITSLTEARDAANAQLGQLRSVLHHSRKNAKECSDQRARLRVDVERLQSECTWLKENQKKMRDDNEHFRDQNEDMKSEMTHLRAMVVNITMERDKLKANVNMNDTSDRGIDQNANTEDAEENSSEFGFLVLESEDEGSETNWTNKWRGKQPLGRKHSQTESPYFSNDNLQGLIKQTGSIQTAKLGGMKKSFRWSFCVNDPNRDDNTAGRRYNKESFSGEEQNESHNIDDATELSLSDSGSTGDRNGQHYAHTNAEEFTPK